MAITKQRTVLAIVIAVDIQRQCEYYKLPSAYHKVWRSYIAQKNRKDTGARTKELMRQRILAMQADKGVSNYRIYKELDLNPGNINDWLKNGAGEKVSFLAYQIFRLFRKT